MQELSDNMTALFVGNRPRKKPENIGFISVFRLLKDMSLGRRVFALFLHMFLTLLRHIFMEHHPSSGIRGSSTSHWGKSRAGTTYTSVRSCVEAALQ